MVNENHNEIKEDMRNGAKGFTSKVHRSTGSYPL